MRTMTGRFEQGPQVPQIIVPNSFRRAKKLRTDSAVVRLMEDYIQLFLRVWARLWASKLRIEPGSQPADKKQTIVEPFRLHTVQHCGKTFLPVQYPVKIYLRA
jgi:hypothetical protein